MVGDGRSAGLRIFEHFLKREYAEKSAKLKNIPLVPKNDIKMHYVDFDAVGVKGLCEDVHIKLKKKKNKENKAANKEEDEVLRSILYEEGWTRIFKMKSINSIGGKKWRFDRCIATDGVACSIRYYRKKEVCTETRSNKRFKKSEDVSLASLPTTTNHHINLEGRRIIGIDPGRKNIASCIELDPNTRRIVKKTTLTSRQFYCDSGYTKHTENIQRNWLREENYKLANEELSKCHSLKSYLEAYIKHYNILWRTKTAKKWRRGNFRVYGLKKRTLDTFINRIVGDTSKPLHIAYGSAKFKATGRGEKFSSPSSSVAKLIEKKVGSKNFSVVDEWNTSKVCHRCFEPLTDVGYYRKSKEDDARILVRLRGLRRCSTQSNKNNDKTPSSSSSSPSSSCPIGGAFVDRDSNAATNIALKLLMAQTPQNLQRGVRVHNTQSLFLLYNLTTSCKTDRGVVVQSDMGCI